MFFSMYVIYMLNAKFEDFNSFSHFKYAIELKVNTKIETLHCNNAK